MNEWLQMSSESFMLSLILPSSYDRRDTKDYITSVSMRKKLESLTCPDEYHKTTKLKKLRKPRGHVS
jgi:hypothetical protein